MKIRMSTDSWLELAQIIFEQAKDEWSKVKFALLEDDQKRVFAEKLNDLANCLFLIANKEGFKLNVGA